MKSQELQEDVNGILKKNYEANHPLSLEKHPFSYDINLIPAVKDNDILNMDSMANINFNKRQASITATPAVMSQYANQKKKAKNSVVPMSGRAKKHTMPGKNQTYVGTQPIVTTSGPSKAIPLFNAYSSDFVYWWDIFIIILATIVCFVTPIGIFFNTDYSETHFFTAFEIMVQIFFALDILVRLNTAMIDEDGNELRDRKKIAYNYMLSFSFIIDVVATLGFPVYFK